MSRIKFIYRAFLLYFFIPFVYKSMLAHGLTSGESLLLLIFFLIFHLIVSAIEYLFYKSVFRNPDVSYFTFLFLSIIGWKLGFIFSKLLFKDETGGDFFRTLIWLSLPFIYSYLKLKLKIYLNKK